MNFDFDDPLGSDDSFFEEPKVLNRRASLTKKTDKRAVENLFNIQDTKNNTETKNVPENTEKVKQTVTFDDPLKKSDNPTSIGAESVKKTPKRNEDWLGESNPTTIPDKSAKKTDLLEDILSIRPSSSSRSKKVTSFDDILKESKLNTTSKSSDHKDSAAPTEATSNFSLLSNVSKERRRSRRGSSTAVEDALGLFGDDYQSGDYYTRDKKQAVSADFQQSKPKPDAEKGVPAWLGGPITALTSIKSDVETEKKTQKMTEDEIEIQTKHPDTIAPEEKINNAPIQTPQNTTTNKQATTDLQNTYSTLQQQETLLLISLQLKKYEENLEKVKIQQQEMMETQEKHYNTILNKCIAKQQMIDDDIRIQQGRINSHIQMLLSSSSNTTKDYNDMEKEKNTNELNEYAKNFENIISTLKQRHQEEMFIMEESYKKQISLLEQFTETLEHRLSNEIANVSKGFEEKINNISSNYNEEIVYYKQKITATEEQHNNEIRLLKENHSQTLEEIKKDYNTQIEYFKELRQQENALLKDGNMYSQKLDTSIDILNSNTVALQVVQEKMINNYDVISTARENSIESKEKEIILMRNALEKCREAAENERSQLLTLIRSLETKIAEQNNNAREERWALQQASATLVARSSALDRESEYNRNVIEREREQLKTLKESLLAEQEKIIMQLTEEKLQLSAERARIEASSRLASNYESEKIKTEAETAIQVTKELTLKINQERDHLYRQKSEVEMLKRSLADRERELNDKEMELEYLTQNAQRKISEDQKTINNARKLEMQYKQRLQELQTQWQSITMREKKLAEEKMLLSKERLALYTSMKQAKGCVLCKANDNNDTYQIQDDVRVYHKLPDSDSIRFRLDVLEDERNSEVSKEENLFAHEDLVS